MGIDIDASAIMQAQQLAKKKGILRNCTFLKKDAWALDIDNRFDVLTSNGLSIYEPSDARMIELHRLFFKSIRPGGHLITSFLTPPPAPGQASEWNLTKINASDALLQKILFSDILDCKWQVFRSSESVKTQLQSVGFESIGFIYDAASIFPTVIAQKPLRSPST